MMKKARTLPKLDLASTRRTIINAWGGSIGNNTNSAFWGRSAEFEVNLKVEFDPLFPSNVIFSLDDEIFWGRSEKDYDAAQFSDSYFNLHRWAEGWLRVASSTLCNQSGDPECRYSFINYIREYDSDPKAYFGDNLSSLKSIKSKYDPQDTLLTSWDVVENRQKRT
jgi:hypothetical protein